MFGDGKRQSPRRMSSNAFTLHSLKVGCNSVKYKGRPPPGSQDAVKGRCYLFREGGAAQEPCLQKQFDFA